MTKKLRGWDSYVADAKKEPLLLPLSKSETVTINFPSKRQISAFNEGRRNGDMDAMIVALLGEEAGTRVIELSEDAPFSVLDELLIDVAEEFDLLIPGVTRQGKEDEK
jgi:hypothetical protein